MLEADLEQSNGFLTPPNELAAKVLLVIQLLYTDHGEGPSRTPRASEVKFGGIVCFECSENIVHNVVV